MHTKAWLVDGKHFYIGSANIDWRALTQVGLKFDCKLNLKNYLVSIIE